jgi:PAS domain S-box-containing protein
VEFVQYRIALALAAGLFANAFMAPLYAESQSTQYLPTISFFLQPHVYQTNWFPSLYLAAFVALVWAGYRLRLRQLQRESRQLRDLVETIPAMAWTALPDGSNEFVNRRWAEFTGLSAEDTAGSGWTGAVHPEDRQPYLERWRGAVAAGEPVESEVRFRCAADGAYRWFLLRGVPLRDADGKVLRWYGTLTDIDDRKRAEEALKRTEAYLTETQKLTHTGTFVADPTTAPLYWSEELFRIFGFDPEHGLPSREQPLERIHPEDLDKFKQAWHLAINGKVDSAVEYRIIWPDGTVKYLYGIGHPILTRDGEVTEILGTTVDITERKRAEQQRETLRELEANLAHMNRVGMMGELAASIAHEVNQPLTGIVSNGSACLRLLAGDEPNVEEAREAVRDIVRDGKRAGEVIARIRAMTKRTACPREKLDLNETIREVLAIAGDEAKRKSVVIRTQFADDRSPVFADRVQLQQVLLNLVINAMDAMSSVADRARQLVIATQNIDHQDRVQVTVKDSGIGLDPQKMVRIFEPFYTTKSGGMGMGLSISRSIVQDHGGRLWATLNAGPGTSFHFTLPKHQGEAQNAAAATF